NSKRARRSFLRVHFSAFRSPIREQERPNANKRRLPETQISAQARSCLEPSDRPLPPAGDGTPKWNSRLAPNRRATIAARGSDLLASHEASRSNRRGCLPPTRREQGFALLGAPGDPL